MHLGMKGIWNTFEPREQRALWGVSWWWGVRVRLLDGMIARRREGKRTGGLCTIGLSVLLRGCMQVVLLQVEKLYSRVEQEQVRKASFTQKEHAQYLMHIKVNLYTCIAMETSKSTTRNNDYFVQV